MHETVHTCRLALICCSRESEYQSLLCAIIVVCDVPREVLSYYARVFLLSPFLSNPFIFLRRRLGIIYGYGRLVSNIWHPTWQRRTCDRSLRVELLVRRD